MYNMDAVSFLLVEVLQKHYYYSRAYTESVNPNAYQEVNKQHEKEGDSFIGSC